MSPPQTSGCLKRGERIAGFVGNFIVFQFDALDRSSTKEGA